MPLFRAGELRDEHIRRYAELLEARREAERVIAPQDGEQFKRPVGRPKSINQQIADETGLSKSTIQRALKPREVADLALKFGRS